jgi:CRP-like cAMP-binding protein
MQDELAGLLAANFPELKVPAVALAALSRLVALRRCARGSVVFSPGQPTRGLYGVLAGEVEVRFVTVDGAVSVVEHVAASRLFGLASFASGLPSTYEAVASRSTRLAEFGPAAYQLLLDEVPGLAKALLCELARRHDGALRLLEAARHSSAIERFTLALAQLQREARSPPRTDAAGWRWLRTTQTELAALAGLSRQTVNELVAGLARQGRLRQGYGGLWLAPGAAQAASAASMSFVSRSGSSCGA